MASGGGLDAFLEYLRVERRFSGLTVDAYGRDLRQFGDYCRAEGVEPGEATTRCIRNWIGIVADGGASPATLRRKLQSLRAWYRWRILTGAASGANPAADVPLPKNNRHLPNFVRDSEMEELLSEEAPDFKSARSRIVVELIYSLGLRRAELLALTDADISIAAGEIRVTGKRSKTRVVPMPPALAEKICGWQTLRDEHYPDLPCPKALVAGPHGHLSPGTLHLIVKQALDNVSSGRKSPHTLRHTFATAMVNNGAQLDAVREMLGHESLSTTQIYTHMSVKEILDGYKSAHPRICPTPSAEATATRAPHSVDRESANDDTRTDESARDGTDEG